MFFPAGDQFHGRPGKGMGATMVSPDGPSGASQQPFKLTLDEDSTCELIDLKPTNRHAYDVDQKTA